MKYLLPFFLLVCFATNAAAQGCSDAGVCTLNAFKPASHESDGHFKTGLTNGLADYDITVFGAYVEYEKSLAEGFRASGRLAALGQSGNGITVFGLSDLYMTVSYAFSKKTSVTFGAKIPLTVANRKRDAAPLPMDYQSSLGTVDLILGLQHNLGRLNLMLGYQQPLTDNDNAFFPDAWPAGSKLQDIQATNQFERSSDVLVRLSYPLKINEKWSLTPSLLPIYHLKEDTFLNGFGNEVAIEGSAGLTFNGNLFVDYKLGEKRHLQLSLASPFLVRDARPDGLTRGYVVGLEYGVRF